MIESKYIKNIIECENKRREGGKKPCPSGKICSPKTGHCVTSKGVLKRLSEKIKRSNSDEDKKSWMALNLYIGTSTKLKSVKKSKSRRRKKRSTRKSIKKSKSRRRKKRSVRKSKSRRKKRSVIQHLKNFV